MSIVIQTYRQPVRIHIERRLSEVQTSVVAIHKSNLNPRASAFVGAVMNPEDHDGCAAETCTQRRSVLQTFETPSVMQTTCVRTRRRYTTL